MPLSKIVSNSLNASLTVGNLTTTGVSTVPAGTVSLPSITTTGDTNTGIFFPAADTIAFAEGGVESMRIDSSGNVCVGSTAPGNAGAVAVSVGLAGTTAGGLQLWASSAQEHFIQWGDATTGDAPYAGAIGYSHASNFMRFYTASIERMRIDSSGNLLVGGTNTTPVQSNIAGAFAYRPTGQLEVNGNATQAAFFGRTNDGMVLGFYSGGTRRGSIDISGGTTSYVTSSDYRLKENVAPMTGALDLVQQLKPVTYNWKVDGSIGQGFIAHELQAVVPDCVTGEKDAEETYTDKDGNEQTRIKPQGIDTSFLVATLTAAIQELKAELDSVKAELQTLKGK